MSAPTSRRRRAAPRSPSHDPTLEPRRRSEGGLKSIASLKLPAETTRLDLSGNSALTPDGWLDRSLFDQEHAPDVVLMLGQTGLVDERDRGYGGCPPGMEQATTPEYTHPCEFCRSKKFGSNFREYCEETQLLQIVGRLSLSAVPARALRHKRHVRSAVRTGLLLPEGVFTPRRSASAAKRRSG